MNNIQRAVDELAAMIRQLLRRVRDLEDLVDLIDRRARPYGDGHQPPRRRRHGK